MQPHSFLVPWFTDWKLLEETLDSGGYPLTTSPSTLKDIVLPPSLFNKLLSVAGANFNSKISPASAVSGPFSSTIPWRKAGLRYTSNEIYIDLIEELRAVVNKYVVAFCTRTPCWRFTRNGVVLSSIVTGKMDTNARLTGYYSLFVVNLGYEVIRCRYPRVPLDIYEFERAGWLRVSSLRSVQFLSQKSSLESLQNCEGTA